MNLLKEEDYMSKPTEPQQVITTDNRIGYADAIIDLYQVLIEMNLDINLRSDIHNEMLKVQMKYGRPQNSNAYDTLPSKLNTIQP